MSRFAVRLAVTLLVPLAIVFLGPLVTLPGVPPEMIEHLDLRARSNVSVFGMGLQPVVTGFWLVELTAILVPRWARARHGVAMRARLERAALVLSMILAVMQAWGIAVSLQGIDEVRVSVPIVMASLVGGVCVTLFAASIVTRAGTMNGIVAFLGAAALRDLIDAARTRVAAPTNEPRDAALAILAIAVAAFATWAALRGAGDAPRGATATDAAGGAYREARRLAIHPAIPIPAGSLQAYVTAASVLMFPATLATLGIGSRDFANWATGDAYPALLFGLAAIATFALAALMHRPRELADFASRLEAADKGRVEAEARAARRAAWLPSLLFLGALVVASETARVGVVSIAILVAALIDLAHGALLDASDPDRVAVREERRVTAVPMLRAALAADGIASEARGAAYLSLLQVFAPYAPARIEVARADAERATERLAALLEGGERAPREEGAPALPVPPARWTATARSIALAGAVLAAIAVAAAGRVAAKVAKPSGPRARLEVVRVDDATDPLADVRDRDLPEDSGIAIFQTTVSLGPQRYGRSHFARVVAREGETPFAARARIEPWLAGVAPNGEGVRFAFERDVDFDPETKKSTLVGYRTVLLTGDPVLVTDDVVDAEAQIDPTTGTNDRAFVVVTLSEDAARRFADATRAWVGRRLAIVVDGEVDSTPIVKTAITGGRMSITMGASDPAQEVEDAKRLASRLRP